MRALATVPQFAVLAVARNYIATSYYRAGSGDHDAVVRVQLNRFRGREVNTSGDGFLAMFDGPQRAIRCAMSIRDAVQALGIDVRAGLHTGECEVRGDDIGGFAPDIWARASVPAGAQIKDV